MSGLILVLDNLRSCHNVGSIIRTANGFKHCRFAFIGTTPYPAISGDRRLPHLAAKQSRQIAKTALGAEAGIEGEYFEDVAVFLSRRRPIGLVCLEETAASRNLDNYRWPASLYLVVGNELSGVSPELLADADASLRIPMLGSKKSHNVAVATGIALYQRYLATD